MTATKKIKNAREQMAPPTEDAWGFWGTIRSNSGYRISEDVTSDIWHAAFVSVEAAFGEKSPEVIRNFLRSSYGRHLADEAFNEAASETIDDLIQGVVIALGQTKRNGRLTWQKQFDEIKAVTEDGAWSE